MANRFIIHGLSEEGKAYRAALVAIQKLHCDDGSGSCEACFFPGKEGDWQSVKHPCTTRRLADEALGGDRG